MEFSELINLDDYELLEYYRNNESYGWMDKVANKDTVIIIKHDGFVFNHDGRLMRRPRIDRSPRIEKRPIKKGWKINLGRAESVVAWDKKDFN